MARKSIKKEPAPHEGISDLRSRATYENIQQHRFPSSGGTIVDTDVVMHEDLGESQIINVDADRTEESGNHVPNGAGQRNAAVRSSSEETVAPEACGGLEILGRGVKELVQAVQNLRHIGIEDLNLPLPKIVVVGDQSTGKSSLIEGISGIKVPRKLGVCTRCPLDINLSESSKAEDPWMCQVSLHKRYVYGGSQGKSPNSTTATVKEGATRARPLGPWILQDPEDTPFASTTKKDEVAALLEWAQTATLNPRSPPEYYLPTSPNFKGDRDYQVKFSPNVVRLDITGPKLPNLSFTDLPGVINVSDVADEEYLVNLVKNLVKEYIKDDKCINLLTLPMTDDPANSSASKLIRDVKAEGRTVGVLTKPDRVQKTESMDQWMQILNGERFLLGHGYHIVMNNPDTSVDHATARAQERRFFQENEPWATELKIYERCFGTLKLQTALSTKLTAQIRVSLPRITQQVLHKAQQVDERLQQLPEAPTGNLPRQLHEKIFVFEAEVHKQFDGGDPTYPFRKEWNMLVLAFRKVMADSRPLLLQPPSIRPTIEPSTPTPARKNASIPIIIDSDAEDDPRNLTPIPDRTSSSKRRIKVASPLDPPSKRSRLGDIPLFTPEKALRKASYSKGFSLNDVRLILQEAHVGLPGQTDPKAIDRMISLSLKAWKEPLDHFLDSTIEMCQTMVLDQVAQAFCQWPGTLLNSEASDICTSFLEHARGSLRTTVENILKWEMYKPTTYNEEAMKIACDNALSLLKSGRREHRARKFLSEQDTDNDNKTPSRQPFKERLAKVTDVQLGPDPFPQEVEAMSIVRGYYECAFSRFVDNVCQAISCELFGTCRAELGQVLTERLGLMEKDDHERCAILLAVNPANERERLQLKKEKEKLKKAETWLEGLIESETNQAEG